jgi:hypothetical protein
MTAQRGTRLDLVHFGYASGMQYQSFFDLTKFNAVAISSRVRQSGNFPGVHYLSLSPRRGMVVDGCQHHWRVDQLAELIVLPNRDQPSTANRVENIALPARERPKPTRSCWSVPKPDAAKGSVSCSKIGHAADLRKRCRYPQISRSRMITRPFGR